jgi:hypothetical protein
MRIFASIEILYSLLMSLVYKYNTQFPIPKLSTIIYYLHSMLDGIVAKRTLNNLEAVYIYVINDSFFNSLRFIRINELLDDADTISIER